MGYGRIHTHTLERVLIHIGTEYGGGGDLILVSGKGYGCIHTLTLERALLYLDTEYGKNIFDLLYF